MNERIAELAEQAAEYAFLNDSDDALQVDVGDKQYLIPANFIEVFARLIVSECTSVSLKSSHRDDDMGAIIARDIDRHFGDE